jgi:SAM-dependent methyltransferase
MTKTYLKEYFSEKLRWGWNLEAQITFDFLCSVAESCKGGVVLDAGSGHQRYKPFFHDCLYIAQEHPEAGKINKGITEYDILCDVKSIPLRDESVDAVLSTSSFEHFEYPQEFVNEAYRVLKPGGSLWIHVPFVYHEHEVPYHFQHPTRFGLERHFRHAGFHEFWVKPVCSSTCTGIFALKYSINEDFKRIKQGSMKLALAKLAIAFTNKYLHIIERIFDQGPFLDTTMPVGWISCATKKGILSTNSVKYDDPKKFILSHRIGA